jgi:hypothetical protein
MKKITQTIFYSMLTLFTYAQTQTTKYLPIEATIIYKGNYLSYDLHGKTVKADITTILRDSSFMKLFPNTLCTVSVFSVDSNGNLSVAGNGITVGKGDYHVVYEFSMFQPVDAIIDSNSVTYCVGISLRLVATIKTLKANLDLSKIISLVAASGGTNKFSGHIQMSIKGINSQTLTNLMPLPPNGATFTADNVATALQAFAAIKSHFYDKDVKFMPEILGFYQSSESPNTNQTANYQKTVKAIQNLR